jgi:hypothetical protein
MGGPGLAVTRWEAHAVERRGNVLVRPLARHAAGDGQRFVRRAATMLATARLCNAHLRMLTTLPMNRQHDLACFIINVGNDLLHESAKQLLACAHRDSGCVPGGCEILCKSFKVRAGLS